MKLCHIAELGTSGKDHRSDEIDHIDPDHKYASSIKHFKLQIYWLTKKTT
jgi:hypothetical protein